MKQIAATALTLSLAAPAASFAQDGSAEANGASQQDAEISTAAERAGTLGSEDNFTGTAFVEPVFDARMGNVNAGSVTFLPGARSHWHTHPIGQWLVVTAGTGWYQIEGEERQVMNAGDVVWFPADVNHWHGATNENSVTHLAVQEAVDGSPVTWGEAVTDEQYGD